MVLRQLFGVPDGEFVSHGDFGNLVFGQGLNDFIVDQEPVYVPELLTRGIRWLDLEPWQRIADQFYQGDIGKLIQYHLDSKDATFHLEGSVIQSLIATVQRLQGAVDALHGNLFHQLGYLALHADAGLVRATFTDWVPTFALSVEGVLFALLFAVAVWLLFHACWRLIGLGSRGLLGATQAPRSGRQSPDGFRAHRIQRRAGPGTEP